MADIIVVMNLCFTAPLVIDNSSFPQHWGNVMAEKPKHIHGMERYNIYI